MSAAPTLVGAAWLAEPRLQRLLAVLAADGEEARIVGGAIRNALLSMPVSDIDIATTTKPDETARRGKAAGFRAVPTGAEHGTITLIASGQSYEVTTLRADIETDGRRAKVRFGRDWKADAERRDFTINALYADADGTIVDSVGGLADLDARVIRFIGDADLRIREDYLRILRFFRFFAWYGGGRPDAEGLKACARLKDGLDHLSTERVWSELKKLLGAPDPSRSLLWMRQAGVLSRVLPESEKWGIDAIHPLVRSEQDFGWPADPLLRLASIVPPDAARMKVLGDRLRLSKAEAERLKAWSLSPAIAPFATESALAAHLYRGDERGIADRLKLALAAARGKAVHDDAAMIEAGGYSRLLSFAQTWRRPVFPVKGADLKRFGAISGPALGELLKTLEDEWIASGFSRGRDALLKRAEQSLKPEN